MGKQESERKEHLEMAPTKPLSFWKGTGIVLLAHLVLGFLLFLFVGA